MCSAIIVAALAASFPFAAGAATISAGQAHVVTVGEQTAVVYFTRAQSGFSVVTTLAAEGRPATRLVHELADGQTALLQAEGAVGAAPATVRLTRAGDALKVETAGGKSARAD
ncbi:MAG TPA: hypothetical protein VEB20_10610 [Azospirillaceae bacterium]|nr:hypothetical protein [Azospirillaceae bacterium]